MLTKQHPCWQTGTSLRHWDSPRFVLPIDVLPLISSSSTAQLSAHWQAELQTKPNTPSPWESCSAPAARAWHPPSAPQALLTRCTMKPCLQDVIRRGPSWFLSGFHEVLEFVTSAKGEFLCPSTGLPQPTQLWWMGWIIGPPAEEENIAWGKNLSEQQPEVLPTSFPRVLHQEKVQRWSGFSPAFKQSPKYICLPLGSKAQTSLWSYTTALKEKLYLPFSQKSPVCSVQLSTRGNPVPMPPPRPWHYRPIQHSKTNIKVWLKPFRSC